MKARFSLHSMLVAAGLALGSMHAMAAPPPTAADVGDADSFGKRVVWIGFAQTGTVILTSDCTPDPNNPLGPNDRCVVLNAAPNNTSFNFPDLGSITLPANSASTLICHWATPTIFYSFNNQAGTSPIGRFNARATYRLESEVLADPALINPQTSAPFNGGIDVSISGVSETKSLAAGEFDSRQVTATRTCIGGLVNKASLTSDYGLSEALAKKFFQKPITIRVGAAGFARGVSDASVSFSTRLTTDEK